MGGRLHHTQIERRSSLRQLELCACTFCVLLFLSICYASFLPFLPLRVSGFLLLLASFSRLKCNRISIAVIQVLFQFLLPTVDGSLHKLGRRWLNKLRGGGRLWSCGKKELTMRDAGPFIRWISSTIKCLPLFLFSLIMLFHNDAAPTESHTSAELSRLCKWVSER